MIETTKILFYHLIHSLTFSVTFLIICSSALYKNTRNDAEIFKDFALKTEALIGMNSAQRVVNE